MKIYIDSDLSMRIHVSKVVSNCFAALRRLRSIDRLVSHSRSCCHWSRHWSWRDSIMAVWLWLVFPVTCWTVCSPCLMRSSRTFGLLHAEVRRRHTSSPGPPLVPERIQFRLAVLV